MKKKEQEENSAVFCIAGQEGKADDSLSKTNHGDDFLFPSRKVRVRN